MTGDHGALKHTTHSDTKNMIQVNQHEYADINMEAAISPVDVMSACGSVAKRWHQQPPLDIDSTDFEVPLYEAHDIEDEKE